MLFYKGIYPYNSFSSLIYFLSFFLQVKSYLPLPALVQQVLQVLAMLVSHVDPVDISLLHWLVTIVAGHQVLP